MKISKVQPEEFAAKFGSDKILEGPFEYFLTDDGLGVIKDTYHGSIQTIAPNGYEMPELEPEEEAAVLATISGDFKEDRPYIPSSIVEDEEYYRREERKSSRQFKAIWYTVGTFITICLVVYIYVFYGNK